MQRASCTNLANFGTAMLTIRVGEGHQQLDFAIYENVFRKASDFADAAMRSPWLESQERIISLPDIHPVFFSVYMQWLLTNKLHTKMEPAEAAKRYDQEGGQTEQTHKIYGLWNELFILEHLSHIGHNLLDTDFTDTVSDALLQCTTELRRCGGGFPMCIGSLFYERIPDGSPTRKLVAELMAWTAEANDFSDRSTKFEKVDSDFVMDLFHAMTLRILSGEPRTSPFEGLETSCKYHCHGKDKPCYREVADRISEPSKKRSAPVDIESAAPKRRA